MKRTLLILALLARVAHADMISRTTGQVFEHAERVQLLRVDELSPRPMATVLESLRGPGKVGTQVAFEQPFGTTYAKGDQILYLCGADLCAVGVEQGGAFRMVALGFDAQMLPGFVVRAALPDLLAGKDPSLCVEARLHFADEPKTVLTLHGDFSARTGQAQVSGLGAPTSATFMVGSGGRSDDPTKTELGLHRGSASLSLLGGPLRDQHGCWGLDVTVGYPLARTQRVLRATLDGWLGTYPVARGQVKIERGHGLPAGTTALVVTWDRYELRWRSKLWSGDQATATLASESRADLGFPVGPARDKRYLSIVTDGTQSWMATGPGVSLPIRLHKLGKDGEVVGSVTLHHVDDPIPPAKAP